MNREDALKRIDEGVAQLHQALGAGRSDALKRYLAVMSRFHRYSFGNVLLIVMQRPEASRVAGYHRWRALGRHVKKGEKGIGILAPITYRKKADAADHDQDDPQKVVRGFKVVHVFDESQTDGEPLPEFAVTHGDPDDNLARIEQVIRNQGIELREEELPHGVNGSSTGGVITVRRGLSPAERLRVLIHELAHSRLHFGDRRHETSRTVRETEAEATAFVVANALGIDCTERSADYIQLYRGDTDTLAESLEFIQKTAAFILDALENVEQLQNEKGTHRERTAYFQSAASA